MASRLIVVRRARVEDLEKILEIYNNEVRESTATYDTEPRTMAEQAKWFAHHRPAHPVFVAEEAQAAEEGRAMEGAQGTAVVTGWASLSPWSDRAAYDRSAETSVYVARESRGRGIGKRLLQELVDAGRAAGHHALLARISADNIVSVRLHEALGFEVVGMLKEVGFKLGRMLDVCIMELVLDSGTPTLRPRPPAAP